MDGTEANGMEGVSTYTVERFSEGSEGNARTAETYRRLLGRMEAKIGKPLAAASDRDILALKKELRGMRSGPWTANILRMFYRHAYRATDEKRFERIADDLRLKQRVKRLSPADVLTLEDVNAMIRAADSNRDKALIVALWETGSRIHEILHMDLGDGKMWKLPDGRPGYALFFKKVKVAGEEHTGYVIDGGAYLEAWLRVHPDPRPEAPLFVSWRKGSRLSYTGAFNTVRTIAKRAKISKRVYPHLFRHSRATFLLQRNVPEAQVKKLLGWTAGSPMLSRYSHLTTKDARDALLRANGYASAEEIVDVRLIAPEDGLKGAVPLVPAIPRSVFAEREKREVEDREYAAELFRRALADPSILEAFRKLVPE